LIIGIFLVIFSIIVFLLYIFYEEGIFKDLIGEKIEDVGGSFSDMEDTEGDLINNTDEVDIIDGLNESEIVEFEINGSCEDLGNIADDCYYDQAILELNASYCQEIDNESMKEDCNLDMEILGEEGV
jgi:hypothetical protein